MKARKRELAFAGANGSTAEANGQFRLVDNHRRVAENLNSIITALDAMTKEDNRGVV